MTSVSSLSNQNLKSTEFSIMHRSGSSPCCDVASRKEMDDSMKKSLSVQDVDQQVLQKVKLTPIDCSFNLVTEKSSHHAMLLPDVLRKRRKVSSRDVIVVFVIRRPGCGACREHGLQLTELYATEQIDCIGIVKETTPDVHDGLLEFYQDYFRFPIYKDEKWMIYEAMGNRKLTLWQLLSKIPQLTKRFHEKKIKTISTGGDHFTQGGILIFDKKRNLRHVYHETFSEEFDMNVLRRMIQDARKPLTEKQHLSHWDSDDTTICDFSER